VRTGSLGRGSDRVFKHIGKSLHRGRQPGQRSGQRAGHGLWQRCRGCWQRQCCLCQSVASDADRTARDAEPVAVAIQPGDSDSDYFGLAVADAVDAHLSASDAVVVSVAVNPSVSTRGSDAIAVDPGVSAGDSASDAVSVAVGPGASACDADAIDADLSARDADALGYVADHATASIHEPRYRAGGRERPDWTGESRWA